MSSDLIFNCSWCHVLQRFVPGSPSYSHRQTVQGGSWWHGPTPCLGPHYQHEGISGQRYCDT